MSDRGFRKSFSLRLFRLFACIILVLAPIFTLGVISYQKDRITDDLVREGKIVSMLLRNNLRTWVFAENVERIRDALSDVIGSRNIDSVEVYNSRGEIMVRQHTQRHPDREAASQPLETGSLRFLADEEGFFQVIRKEGTIDILSPVTIELSANADEALYFDVKSEQKKTARIGYLKIRISTDVLNAEVRRIIIRITIGVALAMFAGLVMLYVMVRKVTTPLTDLAEQVRRFGLGEPVEKVSASTDDEVGRLADAFNSMAENLRLREGETKALQERLKQSEKLEAVGRLARGIAHDFNNILSTIQGSVYLLEKKFSDHTMIVNYTSQIQNSLVRARGLIQSIIIFSKAKTMSRRPVELNSVIRRLEPALRTIADEGVTLALSLAGNDLVILGDAVQIEQLIVNLAGNARDAMPEGGRLSVRTKEMTVPERSAGGAEGPEPGSMPGYEPGRYAVIEVADTGTGIDERIKDKIFEPFFTTRENGKGTGLGLSIVYGIVEQHQGHISLESEKGAGTTFTVSFPLFEKNRQTPDNSQ
ncbi:MAG: sensor histidine kinase [Thermodesulfovibrionales bacterium]